jgi:hypothetical protein
MQVRNARSLAEAIAILLFTSATTNAANVAVCSIVANRAGFDHQNVSLQGAVISLKETTSRAGNDYTTFKLQDGSCDVSIFMWGHPTLMNGDHVCVDGVFESEHHQGRYTFYNEVQATKITPCR